MWGLPYRRIVLTRSGVRLAAWHVPHPGSSRGLVLCHGHDNSRIAFAPTLAALHRAGFHLLLFDFRGMGVSQAAPCTYGYEEVRDVEAAVAWLREEAGVQSLGLYGLSMGGASALLAASRDPKIQAVVTDSAFASLAELVERRLLPLPPPLRRAMAEEISSLAETWTGASIREIAPEQALRDAAPRPMLFIHGSADLLVPVAHARRLAEATGADSEVWVVPHAWHVGSPWVAGVSRYSARIAAFLDRHVRPAGDAATPT